MMWIARCTRNAVAYMHLRYVLHTNALVPLPCKCFSAPDFLAPSCSPPRPFPFPLPSLPPLPPLPPVRPTQLWHPDTVDLPEPAAGGAAAETEKGKEEEVVREGEA
eukprot:3199950-Rhodomonas_salina.2